ncbi:MAG: hypothetical protein JWP87_6393 [Labilithrix sp.]|nr:hypothetical protein [Labilithrix sp.]
MRWRALCQPALTLSVVMLVTACSGGLGTAKADFRKGRIAEAKTELLALEPESRTWGNQRRAEYALYRGLVHHSLGDRAAAGVWLAEAKALEDAQPHTLGEDDRVRLKLALESLSSSTAPASP